jgi:3-polyprenyl-4-hydroxybenzoate decarboxylase
MKGRFGYWEAPRFAQGNPLSRWDLTNSREVHNRGAAITTGMPRFRSRTRSPEKMETYNPR